MTQLALNILTDPETDKNPYKQGQIDVPPAAAEQQQAQQKQSEQKQPEQQAEPQKAEPKKTEQRILRQESEPSPQVEKLKSKYRKGRPRSERSRLAILKATNALLLHTSVQELSIEAIAKRARVGKTTIYRWWPNKTAVVMEALSSQPGMQEQEERTASSNTEALEFQLEKLIRLLHSKNGATIAQLFSEAQGSEKSQEIFENSFLGPLMDAIQFSIEEGKKSGEFTRHAETRLAMDILCGPIFFRLMAHPGDFDEEFEKTFPKQAVRLISTRPNQPKD